MHPLWRFQWGVLCPRNARMRISIAIKIQQNSFSYFYIERSLAESVSNIQEIGSNDLIITEPRHLIKMKADI